MISYGFLYKLQNKVLEMQILKAAISSLGESCDNSFSVSSCHDEIQTQKKCNAKLISDLQQWLVHFRYTATRGRLYSHVTSCSFSNIDHFTNLRP